MLFTRQRLTQNMILSSLVSEYCCAWKHAHSQYFKGCPAMKVTVMLIKTTSTEASTLMNTKDTLSAPAELAGRQMQMIDG